MKNITKKGLLVLMILLLSFSFAFSQVKLDLINQTINDDNLLESLTIDQFTDILGRPSVVDRPIESLAHILGPELFYHDIGLKISFRPQKNDQKGTIRSIVIHLVRYWDDDNNKYFMPYSGTLNPDVNPNMKTNDLISIFEGFELTLKEAEERRAEIKEQNLGFDIPINEDVLRVYFENHHVNFICEELTKFLERITISL